MRPATVSVVTPVYNGADFLDDCIRSVLSQSYPDWEYVIYDNRSTDESVRIAQKYAERDTRVRVVQAPDFASIWANHNRALKVIAPESRYVKFVHADDRLYPECLERMVSVAEAHPSVGIVSSYRLIDKTPRGGGVFAPNQPTIPGREVIAIYLRQGEDVSGSPSTLLYRADLVRKTDRFFDEEFWHADTDAACRVLLDHDCGFAPHLLTYTRLHPAAQTARSFRINTFLSHEGRILIRYGPATLPPEEYRRLLRRFLRRYAWFLGKQTLRPWRYKDADYQQFHRNEIACMRAEARNDAETQVVLAALASLVRGAPPASQPTA